MTHSRFSSALPWLVALSGVAVCFEARAQTSEAPVEVASPEEVPAADAAPEASAITADASVDTSAGEAPAAEAASSTLAPSPAVEGRVVGTRDNDAIVDLGSGSGLALGDRVSIRRVTPVDLGDGEIAYEHETIAIGEVTALTGRRALVRLGSNEYVPIGATAVRSPDEETSDSRVDPPRIGGVWELSGSARLFAVNSALGGGVLGDLSVGYRGERPFFVRARLDPSGFTVHRLDRNSSFRTASAGSAMVMAGIDHRYFGFGAGFGVTRVLPVTTEYCQSIPSRTCTDVPDGAAAGFSFGIHGRIGNQDGLMLSVDASFTTVTESSELSLIDARVQVPITPTLSIHLRGGSGFQVTGASFVDIGARLRARGDGGPGTVYVAPFLGWARLSERIVRTRNRYDATSTWYTGYERMVGERGGPSAGVTVETRF